MFAVLQLGFPAKSRRRRAKLLLIQPNGLGDAIINKPYTDILADATSQGPADIVILASSAWKDFKDIIHHDRTVHFISTSAFETGVRYRYQIYKLLASYTFETAICNLRWKSPAVAQNLLAAAEADRKYICRYHQRHTYLNDRLRLWSDIFNATCLDTNAEPNEVARIPFMYSQIFPLPEFALPRRALLRRPAHVRSFRREIGRFAVFHLGNSERARRWSLEKFLEVAAFLKSQGYETVFCGGPHELDMHDGRLSGFRCFINELTAEEYTALIADASAMLSGDTGPAHLAIALGTPTAIILGGGHFGNYFPYPPQARPQPTSVEYIFREMSCFHCDWDCTQTPTFSCIHGISANDAIKAMRGLLGLP